MLLCSLASLLLCSVTPHLLLYSVRPPLLLSFVMAAARDLRSKKRIK
ncbi:unnamed protein product [Brassica oleracea]